MTAIVATNRCLQAHPSAHLHRAGAVSPTRVLDTERGPIPWPNAWWYTGDNQNGNYHWAWGELMSNTTTDPRSFDCLLTCNVCFRQVFCRFGDIDETDGTVLGGGLAIRCESDMCF